MVKGSFKTKVVFIVAGVVMLATGAIVALTSHIFSTEYTRALQSRSLAISKGLKTQLDRLLQFGIAVENLVDFDEMCREVVRSYDGITYALVVDPNGHVLFHSDAAKQHSMLREPAMVRALEEGKETVLTSDVGGIRTYGALVPVHDQQGRQVAGVIVGFPAALIAVEVRHMSALGAGVGLLVLALGIAVLLIAMQRAENEAEMRTQASTDGLTGVANRREFTRALDEEMAHARRHHLPLSIVSFDLDHFKRVNDTYGHLAGDEVLKAAALVVSGKIRSADRFARWGGEEFIVLTPNVPLDGACQLAERLRQALAHFDFDQAGHVTASFGVASLRPSDDATSLVKRADDALYRAKRAGRNRVETESEAPVARAERETARPRVTSSV
jgi:diguanylate cyclase (GGDEF)-like protein